MTSDLLATISTPADVKRLTAAQLEDLCAEIRAALLEFGKRHGGHIGSNLGLVEACVALHRVFDSPADAIVFDVSHQSYAHKMLTGRAEAFRNAALFGTVTGFTNPDESEHDRFVLGHTGTSVSLACGLAKQRDMDDSSAIGNVVAVIGDGALSSAVAFEGLNNAAEQGGNMIIVFNDNEMSIAENHGGMYATLARMRESNGESEPNLFHAFGLDYMYVPDGNDVHALVDAFESVRDIDHPIVVHIHTTKGLGMDTDPEDVAHGYREGRCEANHWQDPIVQASSTSPIPSSEGVGEAQPGREESPHPADPSQGARKFYGQLAMAELEQRFAGEPGLVVVSPATPGSNGITREFRERAGKHYVDTGITEEHAVAFASGIAQAGGRPVVATSATFFQRAYDEIQQELSLNGNPVTLLSFGGGLSDADNTHSGAYDIGFFGNIPNLTCLAPTNRRMFLKMLDWSTSLTNTSPVVIRVPGQTILDAEIAGVDDPAGVVAAAVDARVADRSHPFDRYVVKHHGSRVAIIGLGDAAILAQRVADALAAGNDGRQCSLGAVLSDESFDRNLGAGATERRAFAGGHSPREAGEPIEASVIDPLQFSTIDEATLRTLPASHDVVVTIEDGQLEGGWGEKITAFYANCMPEAGVKTLNFGARKEFTDRVNLASLLDRYGMTVADIVADIRAVL
ncbi:1-deoxy-D-xylulose-5-phosphate synthase [Bifidobacterium choloepi]|uniref:1-deoxy-D-xylulose-5-phosphate synthase n=1 Tax=Bifidobacterium choloepi TaxID=2614131 RepID=A0A6I5NAB6_9BIFI|nr:1-deoxy-D-xylulose-5-phosphate synthase [Bifidobacterium choloepi]NEG69440.1 1-deoxy-D-xylulose-5-phosphate synthase [Bifidobacterium choloepi]